MYGQQYVYLPNTYIWCENLFYVIGNSSTVHNGISFHNLPLSPKMNCSTVVPPCRKVYRAINTSSNEIMKKIGLENSAF